MSNHNRPLSPHLSIYRWPITMTLSILHRGTGVALSIGFVVLSMWLFDASGSPESYLIFMSLMDTKVGLVLLVGWSFSFFFHLANGIRHLVWDVGLGFEISQANASAWFVLVTSVVLTAFFWWVLS